MKEFKPGDAVYHSQCPAWKGTVIRVNADERCELGVQVFWKGWDTFNPEKEDWTWSERLERDLPKKF